MLIGMSVLIITEVCQKLLFVVELTVLVKCVPRERLGRSRTLPALHGLRPLDFVHSDLMGKIEPPTAGGSQYLATFLNDYSRFGSVALLKRNSETFDEFQKYQKKVERYSMTQN